MKPFIPDTVFVSTRTTEAQRLIYTCSQVARHYYESRGIAVLPERSEPGMYAVLPDLPYTRIPRFWTRVIPCADSVIPQKLEKDVINLLSSEELVSPTLVRRRKSEWDAKKGAVWQVIAQLFPQYTALIDKMEVRITRIGTAVSWSLFTGKKRERFIVDLREDTPVDHIAEAIVSAILKSPGWDSRFSWRDIEAVVDIILTRTSFAAILPRFAPTLLEIIDPFNRQKQRSYEFLRSIGAPMHEKMLCMERDNLLVNNVHASQIFSSKEYAVLRELVMKEGRIVSYDRIGELLWGEDLDRYSLYAISKTMQRIRNKLSARQISPDCLRVVYKQGYVFGE